MRHYLAAALAVTAASLTGCFTAAPGTRRYPLRSKDAFHYFHRRDVVQLDVYLVERPIADACINREIWELADEQVLPERKRASGG